MDEAQIEHMLDSPPLKSDLWPLEYLASRSRHIVEVGTFAGAMAEVMAGVQPEGGSLVTIDPYDGRTENKTSEVPQDRVRARAEERLSRFPNARVMVGRSPDVASEFENGSLDLVFLDGAHDYDSVLADIRAWHPKLKDTGVMAGHDYNKAVLTFRLDFVREAAKRDVVPELNAHCGVVLAVNSLFDTIWISPDFFATVWAAKKEWLRDRIQDSSEAMSVGMYVNPEVLFR